MRFLINAARDDGGPQIEWKVTISDAGGPIGNSADLELRPSSSLPVRVGAGFSQKDLDDRAELYREIMLQDAGPETVIEFGKYLFDTLLGNAAWNDVKARAGGESIELALLWSSRDWELARLPWEAMHDGTRFLATGGGGRPVAMSRLVAEGTSALPSLKIKLRVLFVVGARLNDAQVAASMEYLSLLRMLRPTEVCLPHHIVLEADLASLERAVEEFEPSIVHFIGHGTWDGLEFRADWDRTQDVTVPVEKFRRALGTNPPAIVVLNACDTATGNPPPHAWLRPGIPGDTTPLAARLVKAGIPIVIGMAGRVSEQACRLFTECFYRCLVGELWVAGEQITDVSRAAAVGRSTAREKESRAEWTYPTVWMDSRLQEASFSILDRPTLKERKKFSRHDHNDFCDRFELLSRFGLWLRGKGDVFAVVDKNTDEAPANGKPREGMGPHYAVEVAAARAATLGWVPILVKPSTSDPSKTLIHLLHDIDLALSAILRFLLAPDPLPSMQTLWLEDYEAADPAARSALLGRLDPDLGDLLGRAGRVKEGDVRRTLILEQAHELAARIDLAAAANEVHARNWEGILLVLLHIHEFKMALEGLPQTLQSLVAPRGKGNAGRVRVLVDCRPAFDDLGEEARKHLEDFTSRPSIDCYQLDALTPFKQVYQQYLLTHSERFVFSPEVSPSLKEDVLLGWHKDIKGVPTNLKAFFRDYLKLFVNANILISSNDEDALQRVGVR
jgi:hypothetical protein